MESVIIFPKAKSDLKLLKDIAKRMGFASRIITEDEKEDIALLRAMEEGKKTKLVPRSTIVKKLRKNGKSVSV